MKTRPRIRRATLWGGVVVSALFAVVWAASMMSSVRWRKGTGCMGLKCGTVWVGRVDPSYERHVNTRFVWQPHNPIKWWVGIEEAAIFRSVWIPLWMPLVVSLGVTGAAWRLEVLARRRARVGKCAACGYDRAGLNAGAVCPECGAAHGFVGENR